MRLLNSHLEHRNFLVGDSMTYADVNVFYVLRHFFQMVFNEQFRNQVFPRVTKWFVNMSQNEHILKVNI